MTLHAAAQTQIHHRPAARGPLSAAIAELLEDPAKDAAGVAARAVAAVDAADDAVRDDDVQLSLFLLYALHYGSLGGLPESREWDPELLGARRVLEVAFEARLRTAVEVPEAPDDATADAVARLLFAFTAPTPGPSLARHVAKSASVEQLREFLMHRSIYTLREADPHSWVIPRLTGRAKAALMEIQFDEYGSGDAARAHAGIFAEAMRGAGLDDTYGAYVDAVPAVTLASLNMMSMFGLNRRLRGAIVGHLAAFEMTSSIPNKHYADGFRRAGFGADVTAYFDEHVEADAVHEQIAGRDLAGALAEDEPELLPDILFGAAACLTVDGWAGDHILQAWKQGRSALREGFVASP
ncbi:iron-containing redox enzyme family protein [Microbacterium sp. zg-Y818]|uniref:iron-containing redox enzyme family protein n=1 Tax=unclassified Microbacterium TaxID=2609290 RepID=UPI00214CEFC8|nr:MULTISPECIES: iron-containing redox enzyme family protein [unclassified Microbacterium]MCR2801859.1 iron-containing redox enzyme family protein [Microbacterium sp. zg.Y818]WIM22881.1 iron-containing redox enzyme family protein [Microbacterium sp. zg-Y818]